jgi:hypothetical protein
MGTKDRGLHRHRVEGTHLRPPLCARAAMRGRRQLYLAQTRRQSRLKTTAGFLYLLVFCFFLILFFLLPRTLLPLSNLHLRISFSLQIGFVG